MSTDTEIRVSGVRILSDGLGAVEAERFIALMLREPFDYTNWQKKLWNEKSVDELSRAAMEWRRTLSNKAETSTP